MNKSRQVPRPFPRRVIQDKFPEQYPIFWGPNQRILEDDKYVEPSGFKSRRLLNPPKVVRFITDAHEEEATSQFSCTYEPGHIYESFSLTTAVFAVGYTRKPNTQMGDGGIWWDGVGNYLEQSDTPYPGPGLTQYHDAVSLNLLIVQPDIDVIYPDNHVENKPFAQALGAGHTRIVLIFLWWRWFDNTPAFLGETLRMITPLPHPDGLVGLSGTDVDPRCPEDYFTGCPCLP